MMSRVFHFCDDLINPVAVKEMRQAVQGRFVMSIILLFLLISVSAIGLAAMNADESMSGLSSGQPAFIFFMLMLMSTCLVLIPVYVGVRMSMERRPDEVDLMYATTLKPGAFIRGKLTCGLMLTILIYSLCLPFMTLTYLLRGVDLPTIFALLALGGGVNLAANQITVFVACLPVARWLKILLGLGVLALLVWAVAIFVMMTEEALRQGIPWNAGWRNFWMPLTFIFLAIGLVMGLLYILCVVIVTPSTASRALGARIYITLATLIGIAVLCVWAWMEKMDDPLYIVPGLFVPLLCAALFVSLSERRQLGPRVRRSIPRHRPIRALAFLFYSGAGGGATWSLLLMAVVLGCTYIPFVFEAHGFHLGHDYEECQSFFLVMALYFVGYGFAGLLLQRTVLKRWIKPHLTWGISFVIMILFCVVPMIVAFFMKVEFINYKQAGWFFGNPFALIYYHSRVELFQTVGTIFASAAFLANTLWLIQQMRQFQPLEKSASESIAA